MNALIVGLKTFDSRDRLLAAAERAYEATECNLQWVDPSIVVSRWHLLEAVRRAIRARTNGLARAREFGLEVLLYASGKRQIKDALDVGGLPEQVDVAACVILGERPQDALDHLTEAEGFIQDDTILQGGPPALERLGLDPGEDPRMALGEMMSLLDLGKP